jgi:hypothetical protein
MPGSNFTYVNIVPASGDNPSVDQPNMLTNTTSVNAWVAQDHYGFNTAGPTNNFGGLHQQVTFAANNVPTPPTSPPVLFTNTVGSIPQLFFYSGSAAQSSNQYVLGSLGSGKGSILLFGGIIVKWFSANINASSLAVNFATGLSLNAFPNSVQGALVTTQSFTSGGGYAVGYNTLSTSSITLQKSPGDTNTTNVFVVIIGN